MISRIRYGHSDDAWNGYERFVGDLIEKSGALRVCEIGGGANPMLALEYLGGIGVSLSVLDISQTELDKAPENYTKIVADITSTEFSQKTGQFDLVFSRMLAEHVHDGRRFHENVLEMLTDGGMAVHFFPTFYTLPTLVNRLAPEVLAAWLLELVAPRDRHQHAKFPAYYSWCRGPLRSQLRRFEELGYEIVEYWGYFGHRDYYNRVPVLQMFHELKTDCLLRKPSPLLTSFACVVLKKASRD